VAQSLQAFTHIPSAKKENFLMYILYFYPKDFRMIRDGNFDGQWILQKATREASKIYGF
jgi:hypothetical protein